MKRLERKLFKVFASLTHRQKKGSTGSLACAPEFLLSVWWTAIASGSNPVLGLALVVGSETSRDISFCGHTINEDDLLLVPDASQNKRIAGNPLVADQDGLRIPFYCGCPLRVPNLEDMDGSAATKFKIGTLCVIDQRPRDIDEHQKSLLREFAAMVEHELLAMSRDFGVGLEKVTGSETIRRSNSTSEKDKITIPTLAA